MLCRCSTLLLLQISAVAFRARESTRLGAIMSRKIGQVRRAEDGTILDWGYVSAQLLSRYRNHLRSYGINAVDILYAVKTARYILIIVPFCCATFIMIADSFRGQCTAPVIIRLDPANNFAVESLRQYERWSVSPPCIQMFRADDYGSAKAEVMSIRRIRG